LLAGGKNGDLDIYNVSSLTYLSTISFHNISRDTLLAMNNHPSKHSIGPAVSCIIPSSDSQSELYTAIIYLDSSVSIVNMGSKEVICDMFGHYKKVKAVKFLKQNANEFFTCSKDMSLYHFKHTGDRWTFKYLDIPRLIDASLRYYRLDQAYSKKGFSLTAIAISAKYNQVVCGTSNGSLWIFDASIGNLILHRNLSTFKISSIAFNDTETHIAISYTTGLINLYQYFGNIELVIQLENPISTGGMYSKIILSTDVSTVDFSPLLHQSFVSYTTHNFTTIQLQKITIRSAKAIKSSLNYYPIEEGKITGFDLHPSKEYVVIVSDVGYIYIYHYLSQLKGKVRTGPSPNCCQVDSSGLYIFTVIEKRHLQVYEIGTGKLAAELSNICNISSFDISSNGRYLTITSDKGVVIIWRISGDVYESIDQMLTLMAVNPQIWNQYPIDLRVSEESKVPIHVGV